RHGCGHRAHPGYRSVRREPSPPRPRSPTALNRPSGAWRARHRPSRRDVMRRQLRFSALVTAASAGLVLAAIAAGPAPASAPSAMRGAAVPQQASAGAQLWVQHQGAAEGGRNFQVAASPNGSAVFVAGQVNRPDGDPDAMLWAYNAATGAPLWQAKYSQG